MCSPCFRSQRGFTLVVAMIVLLAITMVSMSMGQGAVLQARITGLSMDNSITLHLAEAALREGEQSLRSPAVAYFGSRRGYYISQEYVSSSGTALWQQWQGEAEDAAWDEHAIPLNRFGTEQSVHSRAKAHYYIERLPMTRAPGQSLAADKPAQGQGFYRITARAVSMNGTTSIILQAVVRI